MGCDTCKKDSPGSVPYVVHEAAQARGERANKRLVIALIFAIVLFFASNALWLWAWTSYDYSGEESTVEIEALDGVANYIGGAGTIRNGE